MSTVIFPTANCHPVALPIWVFAMGTDGYDQRLASFKSIIIWPSLVYLAAATAWAIQKDKRKAGF